MLPDLFGIRELAGTLGEGLYVIVNSACLLVLFLPVHLITPIRRLVSRMARNTLCGVRNDLIRAISVVYVFSAVIFLSSVYHVSTLIMHTRVQTALNR